MSDAEERDALFQFLKDAVPRAAFTGGLPDLDALPTGQFRERGRAIHAITPMLREMWPVIEHFRREQPQSLGLRSSTAGGPPMPPPPDVREHLRAYSSPFEPQRVPAFHALGTWVPRTLLTAIRVVARQPRFTENLAVLRAVEQYSGRGANWESYFRNEVDPGVMAMIDIFSVCCTLKKRAPSEMITVIRNSEDFVFNLAVLAADTWTRMSLVTGVSEGLGTARFANAQLFKLITDRKGESIAFRSDVARKIREQVSAAGTMILLDAAPDSAVRFSCSIIPIDIDGVSMFRRFYRWMVSLLADA